MSNHTNSSLLHGWQISTLWAFQFRWVEDVAPKLIEKQLVYCSLIAMIGACMSFILMILLDWKPGYKLFTTLKRKSRLIPSCDEESIVSNPIKLGQIHWTFAFFQSKASVWTIFFGQYFKINCRALFGKHIGRCHPKKKLWKATQETTRQAAQVFAPFGSGRSDIVTSILNGKSYRYLLLLYTQNKWFQQISNLGSSWGWQNPPLWEWEEGTLL